MWERLKKKKTQIRGCVCVLTFKCQGIVSTVGALIKSGHQLELFQTCLEEDPGLFFPHVQQEDGKKGKKSRRMPTDYFERYARKKMLVNKPQM